MNIGSIKNGNSCKIDYRGQVVNCIVIKNNTRRGIMYPGNTTKIKIIGLNKFEWVCMKTEVII